MNTVVFLYSGVILSKESIEISKYISFVFVNETKIRYYRTKYYVQEHFKIISFKKR